MGTPERPPISHRLLLRAYPESFREEFGLELSQHLTCQREEARYGGRVVGAVRFWWDAGTDALVTGLKLRLGRAGERWSQFWFGRQGGAAGLSAGGGVHAVERAGLRTMLQAIKGDFRQALRALARNPGYALVFILTLGLGIGANTAMFSAVNGVLLRPLPHEDGDRLVYLRLSARLAGTENVTFSVPEIADFREGVPSLGSVAEFSALTFTMLGHDTPRRVRAGIVTGNYFEVMGLSATFGRTVGPEDDGPGAAPVVVLSDPYWRTVFGGDPGVIGKTVEINRRAAIIVGVAEPAPPYPERTDIYANMATSPHHLDATMSHDRVHRMTEVFARLAPGATVRSARAEASSVLARLQADYPDAYDAASGYDVTVTPLKTQLTRRARPTLLLLLGTAFLVLIIACANLANLTLTRVLGRDHELAIRASLGASRLALRRELLIESLILSLAGAGLGLLMAFGSLDLLVAFASRFTARASEIALDAPVFGFALLAAVAASLFFTVVTPLPDSDSVGTRLTRSGTRSTVGSRARRAQRALVVAQIATSFVLLVGAGLLLRTMMHLNRVDPGFDRLQILALEIPANSLIPRDDATRNRYLAILEDVRALPGIEAAALSGSVPLSGEGGLFQVPIRVERHQPVPGAPAPTAGFQVVSPGYFSTMGIEIRRGREFTTTDLEDAQKVVVINESMARAYFGDGDPIGQRVAWTSELMSRFMGIGPEWRTVVGVAADIRHAALDADVVHTMYSPYPQIRLTGALVARISRDPAAVVPAIRKAILAHDPTQPIETVGTLADLSDRSVAARRLNTMLLGAFALLALLIAAVGIGGVLTFSVGRRIREFGIRSALGAARRQIWSGVLAEGATLAGIGVALGAVTAAVLSRLLSGLLYGVPALDPVTFIVVGLLLGAVAMGAAGMPAWRAARVSPTEALGSE